MANGQAKQGLVTFMAMVTAGVGDDGQAFYHPIVTSYNHDNEAGYRAFERALFEAGDKLAAGKPKTE